MGNSNDMNNLKNNDNNTSQDNIELNNAGYFNAFESGYYKYINIIGKIYISFKSGKFINILIR